MQKYAHECDIQTDSFFCAYKCAERYQLRRHIENHRRAINENQSEMCVARFYEFPIEMRDEIKGMNGKCECIATTLIHPVRDCT